MRRFFLLGFLTVLCLSGLGWTQAVGARFAGVEAGSSLPIERIGSNDLVSISVYDSPELSRSIRVDDDGLLRLPMVAKPVKAAGLYPAELEGSIRKAILDAKLLVDPEVTVTIAEYRSRPIRVVGEVRSPGIFQAAGKMNLLDVVTMAGGVTETASMELLLVQKGVDKNGAPVMNTSRVPIRSLMSNPFSAQNVALHGGEVILVPPSGQVYVCGNVKHPGVVPFIKNSDLSVRKAIALSDGASIFTSKTAYIYRLDPVTGTRAEIPVPLLKIMHHKKDDLQLMPEDILYVPDSGIKRELAYVLDRAVYSAFGLGTMYASWSR